MTEIWVEIKGKGGYQNAGVKRKKLEHPPAQKQAERIHSIRLKGLSK